MAASSHGSLGERCPWALSSLQWGGDMGPKQCPGHSRRVKPPSAVATPAQTAALARRCPRLPPGQAGLPGSRLPLVQMTSAALSGTTYNETDFTIGSCGPSSAITKRRCPGHSLSAAEPLLAVSVRWARPGSQPLPGSPRRTARPHAGSQTGGQHGSAILKWPGAA